MGGNDAALSWARSFSSEKARTRESWPPSSNQPFDWSVGTNEAYYDPTLDGFAKDFFEARRRLDYSYHRNPAYARQELQDSILRRVVDAADAGATGTADRSASGSPWILFTAGPMGVGKGYVLSTLDNSNLIPLDRFVKIDPDKLKTEIPEYSGYLQSDAESAATKCHRESTQMADVLFESSLLKQTSMIVDGSLRDVDYHKKLFERIRKDHSQYKIAIIHVTAKRETIHNRAKTRAERTGRVVPTDLLDESIEQVPRSVGQLSPHADVVFVIANDDGASLQIESKKIGGNITKGGTWEDFANVWDSTSETQGADEKCARKKECSLKRISACMASSFANKGAHKAANKVWGAAYPSFCARCTLASDGQCGVCVHGKHQCSCDVCGSACPIQRVIARTIQKGKK
mmetsp:Transcript_37960/g.83233  ORF Transcript_37960/g.83233 Transcript_37960/m.83233 type:complete len:403 (-) Transcript_37960:1263-2471(-)